MKKIMKYGMSGLNYVWIEVEIKNSLEGDVITVPLNQIEEAVAKEIIRQGVALRGKEVEFLRKSLKLSLEKFGNLLGISAPAVLKWERASETRLHPMNEVAVRALVAEMLGVRIAGKFSVLLGQKNLPKKLVLEVA
jgi:DNA-binding transcriptional regulator YiaG